MTVLIPDPAECCPECGGDHLLARCPQHTADWAAAAADRPAFVDDPDELLRRFDADHRRAWSGAA